MLGPMQPAIVWAPDLCLVGKAAGAWRGLNHPLAPSAVVKERVELYLYSPFGLSCMF
jgi:hypothetical protein